MLLLKMVLFINKLSINPYNFFDMCQTKALALKTVNFLNISYSECCPIMTNRFYNQVVCSTMN